MNQDKIEQGVKLILEGIGEDLTRVGLIETPKRIAKMYEEIFAGMTREPEIYLSKVFDVADNEMVIEKDIVFYSVCEHHLLPFFGRVHIGYIPDGKVVGLSKLARTVEVYARRLQLQERMTGQIAEALAEHLKAKGVIVMAEAEHLCMTMRGIQKSGSRTVSMVSKGEFEQEKELVNRFLQMIK
ncbi:MAG: GTP cyclohydrolase I FolE [Lachnospiraceae bacterium]|nr:GTP cyclohydrolase I FolE [Lachnospiraceae bacterium]